MNNKYRSICMDGQERENWARAAEELGRLYALDRF